MASFEEIVSQARGVLASIPWLRQQMATEPTAGSAAVNSVIEQAWRELAIGVGGGISEYLTGRRRYGSRAARAAVDQQRRLAAANLRNQKRQQALSVLGQTEALLREMNDPIDWRIRRQLSIAAARAASAKRWSTILDRAESVLQELVVYSPPDDDVSVVRRLDGRFRHLIQERLSDVDPDWWRTRVPRGIAHRAEVEAQRRSGGRLPALQFLSFGDYGRIILLEVNWTDVFGGVLGNRASFTIEFNELKDLRNDVAHSRLLSSSQRVRMRELSVKVFSLHAS